MNYTRKITISICASRKDTRVKQQILSVEELYERLKTPVKSPETYGQYTRLKKAQQVELKDVGGFVGGALNGQRRNTRAVISRDAITLDFDNMPGWSVDSFMGKLDGIGCGYCVYSTRKHQPSAPRLRVVIVTDRSMSPDEYEPCARRVAERIGIGMVDPTTFELNRIMFYPSVCADSEYVFKMADRPLASVDELLGSYTDWRSAAEWPQVPGAISYQKLAVKQGDPEAKPGIVGAFCRVYDVPRAMAELLPGIYAPVDNDPNRFTYLGGSTTGGAVLYDNGKFLFSHHATDPCSGKLVNAFDLVRLHKFSDMDTDADVDTPPSSLKSYKAMCEFAAADPEVSARLTQERYESAQRDFEGLTQQSDAADPSWMSKIQCTQSGKPLNTIENVLTILENDPNLKGKFAHNEFAGRGEVLGTLPWNESGKRRLWSDTDNNGMYWYAENVFQITGRGNIDAALDLHASMHAFNEVQDYLRGLSWDGIPRLDTLFVDYLGAEDTPYTRAVTRKAFAAAVARAMDPGCKFDNMLILCGPQGVGKSTLLDKMSRGWFNDSIRTFEGKEASELLQGVWIVEIAELDAFRRTDVARIKQFLSLRVDRFRAAYGRHVKELPRCCVFFGTCNQIEFLQDTTGNRRFWPVDVNKTEGHKQVWEDLTAEVIDQLWAEAYARWCCGEELFLKNDLEREAQKKQEEHRETSARDGLIAEFAQKKVPADWLDWSIDRRRDWWNGATRGEQEVELVDRDRISAIEVWCELFNGNPKDIKRSDVMEINAALSIALPDWERKPNRFGPYAIQRGFARVTKLRYILQNQM